jgi:O-antigen/teichoic acid export membrane protein
MKRPHHLLFKGAIWTIGAYGINQLLRLVTNIILARFLAPEVFGIMTIANSIRLGVELLSDIGIGQNVVSNINGEKPEFYNTAWTLALIRGAVLWLVCSIAAIPLAHFYNLPILRLLLPVYALICVIAGFNSVGLQLLKKRMQYSRLNAFEAANDFISSVVIVTLVYLNPTIWAVVLATLVTFTVRSITSHIIMPEVKRRFCFYREYVSQILKYGKWIFISSFVFFLSMQFDRLYMGKVIPLGLFGVYGIAQSLSGLFSAAVLRLGYFVIFPLIASSSAMPRAELRRKLTSIRLSFIMIAAIGVSAFVASADLLIRLVYDQRYQSVGWMLSILSIGSWFGMICNVNESTLLGLGVPRYNAFANTLKFGWLLLGLPIGFATFGVLGAIIVVATSDLCRYIQIFIGQSREDFSFGMQDSAATVVMFGLIVFWEWLRWSFGLGISFNGVFAGSVQ